MILFTGLANYIHWKSQQLREKTMSRQTLEANPNKLHREKEAMARELDQISAASRTKAQALQARIIEVDNVHSRLRGLIAEVRGSALEGIDLPEEKPHIMSLEELLSSGPDMLGHFTNQLHDSIAELRDLII